MEGDRDEKLAQHIGCDVIVCISDVFSVSLIDPLIDGIIIASI